MRSGGEGPIYLWSPAGFEPIRYIGEPQRKRADLARFVLHKIIWANVFKQVDKKGFVSLKAKYLRTFFPDSVAYSLVMRGLIDGGAILCDGHYIEGQKSFGYKLSPEISRMRQSRSAVMDPILARKIAWSRARYIATLEPVHRHLYEHLQTVQIDAAAALSELHAGDFDPANETAIQLLRGRDFHFAVCPYGRVHTNLTCLKSELRKHLSVRGEPLVNLDIRNSQPLVFASILKDRYEFSAGESAIPSDVLRYVELVQAGQFYDHLMEGAGIPQDERAGFKRNFFGRVFFCENSPVTKEAKAFGRIFPNVYRLIRELKADRHESLAWSLQRRESSIMIGGIATRCMAEMPHVFIGTVHDSIMTLPRYTGAIQVLMREEFAKVGLNPTIRIEAA